MPFFLRTGKRLAEGQRIISIAFREPPKSMFPPGSGVGAQGPDHLTFDLADASKMSLSFYGKRPGPGMRLDKLSLQFAMHDTGLLGEVLEAYERLILDAMRGDRTLFTTAEGIERLWQVSMPLLEVAAAGAPVRAGIVGAEVDPPADRAACLAAAVRACLARRRIRWAAESQRGKGAPGQATALRLGGRRCAPTPLRCLYGRLPCGKRVLASSGAADQLRSHIRPLDATLQAGCLAAAHAGLDGHSRGRCSSPVAGLASTPTRTHSALPARGLDRFAITSSTRLTHSLLRPLLGP